MLYLLLLFLIGYITMLVLFGPIMVIIGVILFAILFMGMVVRACKNRNVWGNAMEVRKAAKERRANKRYERKNK